MSFAITLGVCTVAALVAMFTKRSFLFPDEKYDTTVEELDVANSGIINLHDSVITHPAEP